MLLRTPLTAPATSLAKSTVASLPLPAQVRLAPVDLSVMPVSASEKICSISGSVSFCSAI